MGQQLDYLQTGQSPKSGQKCWQIRNGWVHIYGLDNPATWLDPNNGTRVSALAMTAIFDSSGMTPADFVKQPVALGNVTRVTAPFPQRSHISSPDSQNATLRLGFGISFQASPFSQSQTHDSNQSRRCLEPRNTRP